MLQGLPFRLEDYLELIDWAGGILSEDKRSAIPGHLPRIIDRLDTEPKHWLLLAAQFESHLKALVGGAYALKRAAQKLGYQRTPGMGACKTVFAT